MLSSHHSFKSARTFIQKFVFQILEKSRVRSSPGWAAACRRERAITRSPDWIMPLALSREKVRFRLLSMSSEKLRRKGMSPH